MAQHALATGPAGDPNRGDDGPRASVRARDLPPAARRALDDLFRSADQHGPRLPDLVRRIAPALLLVPALVLVASWEPWRGFVIDAASPRWSDVALIAPALVSFVLLAGAMAPLARARTELVVAVGAALLGCGAWMVTLGWTVAATTPSAIGAVLVGVAAARAVRRAVWALPLLLAAGISDAHSVSAGVTEHLLADGVSSAPAVERLGAAVSVAPAAIQRVDMFVLHVPAATGTWMLGIVDVVALGLLLGLAHLFWLPLRRTVLALGAALLVAIAVGSVVPVLPLLGLAWIAVHARLVWRSTRFSLRRLTYLGG